MESFLLKIWQGNFFDYNKVYLFFYILFMWEEELELQKKINRLMHLKFEKHKKIAKLSRFIIFLYSVLVFFAVIKIHGVTIYLNSYLVFFCAFLFVVFLRCFLNNFWWNSLDNMDNVVSNSAYIMVLWIITVIILLHLMVNTNWRIPIEKAFEIFAILTLIYFFMYIFSRKVVKADKVLLIYFLFYSLFLFPVLLSVISEIGFLWNLFSILFGISPFFFIIFRSYLIDFFWSWMFIRRWFSKKDADVWNCPQCHVYILKKPVRYCPHCGADRGSTQWFGYVTYCHKCWFTMKIRDFDFPCCCPHCGLPFRWKKNIKRIDH